MNSKQGLVRSARVWSAVLLCCSALVPDASALDNRDPNVLLHVDGGAVSADIQAAPLVEVARALKLKTGVTLHFPAPQMKNQVITTRFEKLALVAALQAILKNTNYALVTGPTKQGGNIQVYVYSQLPGHASNYSPVAGETEVAGQAADPASQSAGTQPEDRREPPAPPEVFDGDPAVRVRELEGRVAADGPQSLALILTATHDADPLVRSASEQLLLNDLRHVVPRETLSTIALSSERADLRLQALEVLAARQDQVHYARMTLDGALRDPDHTVRQRAEALLLELSASEPELSPSQGRAKPKTRSPR